MTYSQRGQEIFARSQASKARATAARQANQQALADSRVARVTKNNPQVSQAVGSAAPFTPQAGGPQLPGGTPQGGFVSGSRAALPSTTPNATIVPDKPVPSYGAPAGGNTSSIANGYNTGATTSYQGGAINGMGGGMPNAMSMPNQSLLPAGAAFKKGGYVNKVGKINLGSDRVSTVTKNKSNSNW